MPSRESSKGVVMKNKPNAPKPTPAEASAVKIAKEVLEIETLESRGCASLDFYDLYVGKVKEALVRAFELGRDERATRTKGSK